MHPEKRHPEEVPGDFYVQCEICLACEIPCDEAPDLMGRPYSSEKHHGCFFLKQPATPDEIDRACNAVSHSCIEAVRYTGNDAAILQKLYDLGAYISCDRSKGSATNLEQCVIDYVTPSHQVRWTYICENTNDRTVVACCYGPYPFVLSVFGVDKTTLTISMIDDDQEYRPKYSKFARVPRTAQ